MTDNVILSAGDACNCEAGVPTLLAHVVNNRGLWGAGFVLAISRRWPEIKRYYDKRCKYYEERPEELLGSIQCVDAAQDITVVNMFAMAGVYHSRYNPTPLQTDSLFRCLKALRRKAETDGYRVIQMPKIGAGLARGDWSTILKIIKTIFAGSAVIVKIKTL